MRFMLLENYSGGESCEVPMMNWIPRRFGLTSTINWQ